MSKDLVSKYKKKVAKMEYTFPRQPFVPGKHTEKSMMKRMNCFEEWLTGERHYVVLRTGTMSEVLTVINPRHTANRIRNASEYQFRLCVIKLITTTPWHHNKRIPLLNNTLK